MTIGGEHIIEPKILLSKPKGYLDNLLSDFKSDFVLTYTFGGYYSILAIIDALKSKFDDNSYILLPSYLCPSILKPFKNRNIKYKFYKVNDELQIDITDLLSNISHQVKAVYFIDYFGASQMDNLVFTINILRSKNITIIQDVVQCLYFKKEFIFGDYAFNSFRKFFPFEGSVIISKKLLDINFSKKRNRYIKYKRTGQFFRYLHLKFGLFPSKTFLNYLQKAESVYYENEILEMPEFNKRQLNKYDLDILKSNNIYYYGRFYNALKEFVPALLHNQDFVPLGFVIKIENRDTLRDYLFNKSIFPPIHWKLSEEIDSKHFQQSTSLSDKILTLPLIGLNEKKIEYLFESITKYLKK